MIFNHKVKHNGVTYPAGVDVPVGNAPAEIKEEKVVEEVVKTESKPVKKTSSKRAKK